jgi:hypothetical protein
MRATVQIFLSYAREDEEKVEDLYQKLSDASFKPWMDTKDILPGERWKSSIQKAIRRSDFFLACLSANSVNKRGFLQKEIKDALDIWLEKLDSDIYLIPVRLEDCEVPESLRVFQWVNLFEEDGWPRLAKAIQVGMERWTEISTVEEGVFPATEVTIPEEGPEWVLAVESLARYITVRQIAHANLDVTYPSEDLTSLGADVAQVWPRLLAVSRDVQTALASDSIYNRLLGFRHAREDLNALQQQLLAMGEQAMRRWQPAVDRWLQILDRELDHPLLEPGKTVINPYNAGSPITANRAVLFRGRRDLANVVERALLERSRPTIALHGPRRMGKTSFLLQLPRLLPGRAVPIFVDLQRPDATDSTARFLYTVARAVVNDARNHSRLTLPAPRREAFEREPFVAFADWLDEAALPALEKAGRFTFLLSFDEFEKLGRAIEMKRVDERVLDELRHTIQHREAVSLLFAGVQTLEELGPRWSSYFINIRPLRITYLRPQEAESLVRSPERKSDFSLEYTDEAVEDILATTRCHPYLVQLVCSAVVNLVNEQRTLLVMTDLVRDAQTAALAMGEPYFRNVWDEFTGADTDTITAGRIILRKVAAASGPVAVTAHTLAAARALERLLRHDVLERVDDGVQFQVPLVQRWVRERAPVG